MLKVLLLSFTALELASASRTPAAQTPHNAERAARIDRLLWTVLTTDDDAADASAKAEARKDFEQRGLPTIAEVGDEAAYEFVVLAYIQQPEDFRVRLLEEARRAAARREIPADALAFLEARTRIERNNAEARKTPPRDPDLRDKILRMAQADQEVRRREGFDLARMEEIDKQHEKPLKGILDTYGVPTISLVGPEAAAAFVLMAQHQRAEFRRRVLPVLKSNVDVGEANADGYAMLYDRLARNEGGKQKYGTQLECDAHGALVEAPTEDPDGANQRRADLGLLRVALYERLIRETQPNTCAPASAKP